MDKLYKNYVKASLEDTYFMLCIKKCIKNYETDLNSSEKACMAKCLDRSHDYLILAKKLKLFLNLL